MRRALVPWFFLGASLPALAQEHPSSLRPAAPAADLRASVGLAAQPDGSFQAGGADYRARLGAAGMVYEPALGRAVEHTQSLALSLRSIERGGLPVAVGAAHPQASASELALELARGAGVTERYDVRPEGVELSYRFEEPLPGSGDLVVRLALSTTLPRPAEGEAGSLAFELPGVGGVSIGAVLGIDADGDTAQGSLRLAGDELALVLPAAFVDSASYPLVLDPLVGSVITVIASGNDDTDPDAAYDMNNNVYLVVWQRIFSATDSDIRGQRVSGTGALTGSTIFFTSDWVSTSPAVANLAAKDRFAVVWLRDAGTEPFTNSAIACQFVEAATGALSTVTYPVSVGFGTLADPDVCGEGIEQPYAGAKVDLVIVYDDQGNGEIRLVHGAFDAATDVLAWDPSKLVLADDTLLASFYSQPAIARASGIYGRTMIAVRRTLLLTPAGIRGYVVNVDGTLHGPSFLITGSSLAAGNPDIDGFDRQWMAAWEASDGDKTRIQMAPISLNVSTGVSTVGAAVDVQIPGIFSQTSRPAVGFSSGKTWIGWRESATLPSTSSLRLKGFDSVSCVACEGFFTLDSGSQTASQFVAVATPTSGGAYYDDRGLATWSIVGLGGDVKAQLLTNNQQQGSTQNLGGGCGAGGTVGFSAAPSIGSSWWWSYVIGLPADAPITFANFSFADPSLSLTCGSCAWMPFALSYSPPLQYDPLQGNTASAVAIIPCNPALVGAKFTVQWTTATPSSSPCGLFPGFSISDRHRVTIGQ